MTTTISGSFLGHGVKRTEDRGLVTGAEDYTADLPRADALHVTFVRSPFAHGTLDAVDVTEARQRPGVVAVYTADDLALPDRSSDVKPVKTVMARPPLARGRVRFVGDIVAVVVAGSAAEATDAAESVLADITPLPAVAGVAAALADDAPLLYPEHGSNVVTGSGTGEVEGLFDDADVVVREEFLIQRIAGVPMEPGACLAVPGEPDGGITVWLSGQNPHDARDAIAGDLGLDAEQVRVICPRVGGGFGVKIFSYVEWSVVARIAQLLDRPVRWAETRSENMQSMTHGRSQHQHVELGLRRDGRIVGLRATITGDGGAYPTLGASLPALTQMMAQGVYDIPAAEVSWRSVVTTTTPVHAYRGAGRPEATQMIERILDVAADELGIDPTELRRRNFLPPERFPLTTHTGAAYDNGEYAKVLDAALEAAGYDELRAEQARRREAGDRSALGIGVSTYVEVTAPTGLNAEFGSAQAHPDGTFTVMTGTSAHGQGHQTAYAQLAASLFGVEMDRIRVVQSDTALVRSGAGTSGSRSLQIGGTAIWKAGEELIAQAREIAAHLLEATPDDLETTGQGGIGVRGTDVVVTWAQVASAAENGSGGRDAAPLLCEHDFTQEGSSFPFGSHVAVVEVDLDTGMVRQLRHIAVDDCGRILNPVLVTGQQHGGIAQGISQALFERVTYDSDGNPTSANMASYIIPAASDLCSFETSNTETPTHLNPLGAKGIGESGTIGSTPAVHNAVVDAVSHLGVRHIDMPLTPEAVWRGIQGQTPSTSARPAGEPVSADVTRTEGPEYA